MIKNFTLVLLSCFALGFLNSCENEVGSLEAGPVATYTFTNTSAPVVAGIYAVNWQMDVTNTITLTVNVAVKGKYNITTNSANGVSFECGGVFTTTGPQTVVLYGKGTPVKTGNFSFATRTGGSGNFAVSFLPYPPPAVFTFSGGTGACSPASVNGTYTGSIDLNASNYVDITVNITTLGTYSIVTNTINNFFFGASGTFTTTGPKVVRLSGQGKPVAGGTYTFAPPGGCSFSIGVAPPPPPAAFTYACTPAVQSGTFAPGTALTVASTVKIDVIVTTAGLYSITTTSSSSNGVTFSGFGILGVGAQTITLTSSNTPAAAGMFSYTPTGASCTFDVTYTTGGGGGGGGGGGTDYLKCTIDGTAMDFSSSGLTAILAGGNFNVGGSAGSAGLSVVVTDNGSNIAVGTYDKFSMSNTNKFCLVTYTPNTASPGSFWLPGFMNSNPFTVTIETITTSPNRITGKFSGDLFDGAGSNKKVVTNGTFSVPY